MTRREIRDSAFKLVFEQLLRDDDIQELYDIADEIDEITVNDEVKKIVEGTIAHADELDEIISGYSRSRAISRISKLNLAILRIALYESIYDDNTPMNAAISEAIKLLDDLHLSGGYIVYQRRSRSFFKGQTEVGERKCLSFWE